MLIQGFRDRSAGAGAFERGVWAKVDVHHLSVSLLAVSSVHVPVSWVRSSTNDIA